MISHRIAISGASGLVGSALGTALSAAGHTVVSISRSGAGLAWDGREVFDAPGLRACDAIIHLAGAGIAERRWNTARRREIRDSRVIGTTALARLLAAEPGRVQTLIVASGTGWYGERGETELDERSSPGSGFLAEVCRDWELAADPCRQRVRVVHLRTGVVLSAQGGALAQLLPPARFGLASPLGSGRQWWSWIARADLVRVIQHALAEATLSGPLNAVAPVAVRQADLARAVAVALGRPALAVPVPACLLRIALGGMVDELLLCSARVLPVRLQQSGFHWENADLAAFLRAELGA